MQGIPEVEGEIMGIMERWSTTIPDEAGCLGKNSLANQEQTSENRMVYVA